MMFKASSGLESIFFKDPRYMNKNEWGELFRVVDRAKKFYLSSMGYDELDEINTEMYFDLMYYDFFRGMCTCKLVNFLYYIRHIIIKLNWGFIDRRFLLFKLFSMFSSYIYNVYDVDGSECCV